jgi:hypothetical protein
MRYVVTLTIGEKTGKVGGVLSDEEFNELPYVREYGSLPSRYSVIYLDGDDDPQWAEVEALPTAYEPSEVGMQPVDLWFALWRELDAAGTRPHT